MSPSDQIAFLLTPVTSNGYLFRTSEEVDAVKKFIGAFKGKLLTFGELEKDLKREVERRSQLNESFCLSKGAPDQT
jgi:hypothetical protein